MIISFIGTSELDRKLAEAQEKIDEFKTIVDAAKKEKEKERKKAKKTEKQLELLTRFVSTNPSWEAFISQSGSRHAAGGGAGAPAKGSGGESGSGSKSRSRSGSGSRSGSSDDDQDDDEGLYDDDGL